MAETLPILTFHSLDAGRAPIAFHPELFRNGLARLHAAGYRALGLEEVAAHIRVHQPFPEHALAITFDDGYQTVYSQAFPALQEHGLVATVFLTVGEGAGERLPSLCDRRMLSWREIREMHAGGIAFGAHTLTHPDLTTLPPDQAEAEVLGSKTAIEQALGEPVRSFAYPFGRHDAGTRALVGRHFACACSDALALVCAGSDPLALPRVDAYYLRRGSLFGLLLGRWLAGYVRVRALPRALQRRLLGLPA